MIKGKYVATIELNFNVDESTDGLLPFETLQAKVTCGELDKAIVAVISDEFRGALFCWIKQTVCRPVSGRRRE